MEGNGIKSNDDGAVSVKKGLLYLDTYPGKIRVTLHSWVVIDNERNNKLYILSNDDFKEIYERVDYE